MPGPTVKSRDEKSEWAVQQVDPAVRNELYSSAVHKLHRLIWVELLAKGWLITL